MNNSDTLRQPHATVQKRLRKYLMQFFVFILSACILLWAGITWVMMTDVTYLPARSQVVDCLMDNKFAFSYNPETSDLVVKYPYTNRALGICG